MNAAATAQPLPATAKDLGHTPVRIGLWVVCEICRMTLRKSGWWKPCPGPAKPKRYMGE